MNQLIKFSIFSYSIFLLGCGGCTTSKDEKDIDPDAIPMEQPDILSDEALLNLVQENTFKYFWDLAEPISGMARERYHEDEPSLDKSIVTTGGTGFGIMAILVGIKRGYITRNEGYQRIFQITAFLESVPRFHGVWSHWLDGGTATVVPFSQKDNGGDLVETSFLIQGLLCARQFFINGSPDEQELALKIDKLWKEVEWNFYRGISKEDVLFWHWSPNYSWEMNFRIRGYNESLITYVLAASSPTYAIDPAVYHNGWAENGSIRQADQNKPLALFHQGDEDKGGPLFWAHYSFLGLDPRELQDIYANYWDHNVNHALVNRQHCVDNPHNFRGYGAKSWGLTASYSMEGYAAHHPNNDLSVISPTAALSSFPYTPDYSMQALRYFYEDLGSRTFGSYGFYDAFSEQEGWYPRRYLAIDQGPIIIMIENYRSGFLWELFMSSPEIRNGLDALGFE